MKIANNILFILLTFLLLISFQNLTDRNYRRYFNLSLESNVMRVGEKQEIHVDYDWFYHINVLVYIPNEEILSYDNDTNTITALMVGETRLVVYSNERDFDHIDVVVI